MEEREVGCQGADGTARHFRDRCGRPQDAEDEATAGQACSRPLSFGQHEMEVAQMAKRKFRVGIVGCGGIANTHATGWLTRKDEIEVVATCDVDIKRARELAQKTGAREVLTDYRKLVALKDLDAVDICTPNMLHTPGVLAALNAGKHVVCEKPLAVTTAEVRKMGMLADRKRLKLMTAQSTRWSQKSKAVKKFIAGGAIGTPIHARVYALRRNLLPSWGVGFIDRKLSGGGPCMDIGVHALDLCMWLTDFPKPVRVTGRSRVNFAMAHDIPGAWGEWDRKRFTVEDHAVGFVHFDNGMTMVLEASWLNHQEANETMQNNILGSKGGVEWPTLKYWSARNHVLYDAQIKEQAGGLPAHTLELLDFCDCVVNNKPSPVPWQETIKVIAILEAIYSSESQRKEIRVKL
ncbi:MAG: oxidoreductase [Verrucomicrobia bacterium]|nr:oxidoreductase [Verrucomicrobiota bacterium]